MNNILPHALRYENPRENKREYASAIKRHNHLVFNRRTFLGNILWVIVNIVLTKIGIMLPSLGNILNVSAFILTSGSIVQRDYHIGRWLWTLELGAVLVSIAIWLGNLL